METRSHWIKTLLCSYLFVLQMTRDTNINGHDLLSYISDGKLLKKRSNFICEQNHTEETYKLLDFLESSPKTTGEWLLAKRVLMSLHYPLAENDFKMHRVTRSLNQRSYNPYTINKNGYNRKFIFGKDNRKIVNNYSQGKNTFYKYVMYISVGCTGTLVTPYHVITAAHCVNNGQKFKKKTNTLKVYYQDTMGLRYKRVKYIHIPRFWIKLFDMSDIKRAMFDFAVLELASAVRGRWHFMDFDWKSSFYGDSIRFVGFPADAFPNMVQSSCKVIRKRASLLLNKCDSVGGVSGAAALSKSKDRKWKIIGVLSGVVEANGGNHVPSVFNVINRFNLYKLRIICAMLEPEGDKGVCRNPQLKWRAIKTTYVTFNSKYY